MCDRIKNPARDRMEDRVLYIMMPLLVANIALAFWEYDYLHLHPSRFLAILCAIVYALLCTAFVVIFGMYLKEEKDEFERSVWVQSMLWGIGAILTFISFWGALVEFELVKGPNLLFVFPWFFLVTGVARLVLKLRYR